MQQIGRRVLGLSAIALAAVSFKFHNFNPLLHPVAGHFAWLDACAFVWDSVFVLAGLAAALSDRIARTGALVLAVAFLLRALISGGPALVQHPTVWGSYENFAEAVAMGLGAVFAWLMLREGATRADWAVVGRIGFGLCLIVFGISDSVYPQLTAPLVPKWLPPSQLFWAYFATAAHVAAGLAVLSGIKARLAAVLVTIMYASWQLIVHLPLVIQDPHSPGHWSEFVANLVLMGAAWCLAEYLTRTRKPA
ncbi:MAG TPA: DoxX family membrane protein [Caulobacteraceae bacterium]|jgi:uncharacterized membrane protein YphA (DoxX/SURF4 family)|nr:DoxX family membrane protein [Caulobacteraceae bacterium]